MPLKLEMKMGDRVIINGAVLEVATPHAKIIVHNQASILRGKEILSKDQAVTPATRVYFALQNAYLFPENADDHLIKFQEYLEQYLLACPSAAEIATHMLEDMEKGQLYKALKSAHELVVHQRDVLTEFEEQISELATIDEESPDSPTP